MVVGNAENSSGRLGPWRRGSRYGRMLADLECHRRRVAPHREKQWRAESRFRWEESAS